MHGDGLVIALVHEVPAFRDRLPEQDPRELLFEAYLVKPCPPEHLVLAVEAVLQRRV